MTGKLRIVDTGAFIPHAKKHLAQPTGSRFAKGSRLSTLFPEPDWAAMVDAGRPLDCVAHLAMIYDSLATGPKAGGTRQQDEAFWADAYDASIRHLKQFFAEARTLEDAKGCARWMAARIGLTPQTVVEKPMEISGVYWAASRGGTRSFYPPGSLTTRQALFARWLPLLGWPINDDCLKASVVPVELVGKRYVVGVIKGNTVSHEFEPTDSIERAVGQARAFAAKQLAASARVRVRKSAAGDRRIGPNVLPAGDITPEVLIETFKFRGVQFGEWVPQNERREWMARTFEALEDLAQVTGLRSSQVGLGSLGLAIGARGDKGFAAHYEPGLRVLNFTRHRGAGALAHEFFHALDHALSVEPRYTSLLQSCEAELDGRLEPRAYTGATGASVDFFRGLVAGLRASQMRRQAARIERLPRAGHYWVSIEELGARAFEAWVEDTLAANGRVSPYLVSGTLERDHEDPSVSPYPVGAERAQIGAAMASMVSILRTGTRGGT